MSLPNDNDRELRDHGKLHVGKGGCEDENRTSNNYKQGRRRTLDLRNLLIDDLLELTFRDAIAEEDGPLGEGLVAVTAGFEFVVDMHSNAVLSTTHPPSETLRASIMYP